MSTGGVRFPIVMKVWAGAEEHDFEYVSRSIPSLLASDLPRGAEVVIFDDASTNQELRPFLESVAKGDPRVRLFRNERNKGPNRGQEDAYAYVGGAYPEAPFFVNVDDDVIYHRDWMSRLLHARDDVTELGLDGIYTALNMPWRTAHARLRTKRGTYLLKRKQPALNWLIPREIYQRVGPFRDEGIAYDTVYSHWLRLHGYPVICLEPSWVQNIGTYGAYSRDDTTTAYDYVGDGRLGLLRQRIRRARRLLGGARRLADPYRPLWPIRWGSDWVYEAASRDGSPVAVFLAAEAERLGDSAERAHRRAAEVQAVQPEGPFAIRDIHRTRGGRPLAVECDWRFWPNLRECRRLPGLRAACDPQRLFSALVGQLAPLHRSGVVHNKVRRENVYFDPREGEFHLAWFGTEPPAQRTITLGNPDSIDRFGCALDPGAHPSLRASFAAAYLEAIAPEVLAGGQATPQSDLYSAAAVVTGFATDKGQQRAEAPSPLRPQTVATEFVSGDSAAAGRFAEVLALCLSPDPARRPRSAATLRELNVSPV